MFGYFVVVLAAFATLLGINQVREIDALKNIVVGPGLSPFQLKNISGNAVSGVLQLVFKNPSSFKVEIRELAIEIFFRGEVLAVVPPVSFIVNASKNTTVNVPLSVEMKKLLRLGEDVLLKSSAEIVIKGKLNYTSQTLRIHVPLDFEFPLDVKAELNNFLRTKINGGV